MGQSLRPHRIVISLVASAGLMAGLAISATPALASTTAIVETAHNAKLGTILVNAKGYTLYRYTADSATKVACTSVGGCTSVWPPLLLPSGTTEPVGKGVSGLGTIKDPNGKLQVTYKGHPLYLYVGDKRPGVANGQKLDGSWFAVTTNVPTLTASTTTGSNSSPSSASSSSSATNTAPAAGYGY